MKRNDWIGMAASLLLHAGLLALFTIVTAARPEPQPLGFIEVDLGPIASGRAVRQGEQSSPVKEVRQEQQKTAEKPKAAPPRDAKPVRLPEQKVDVPDAEKVRTPKTEKVAPEKSTQEADVIRDKPEPEPKPVTPKSSGTADGKTGAESGKDGAGEEEAKSAPYQIEGLNRDIVFGPPPAYREQVNATIRFRIVVNPRGQVVSAVPVRKANPSLESAARDVLLARWRFNPLPPNAPQDNQVGVVTFHFRLE